jgi:hypothetical protein
MKKTPKTQRVAIARPPSRLPNGKVNPEYTRWYRTTPQGRAAVQKWNSGEGLKRSMKKYRQTDKAHETERKLLEKKRDRNEVIRQDQCKCVECGMVFDKIAAALEGFRHLPKNRYMGICNSCG